MLDADLIKAEIAVLRLEPGDVLVLTVPQLLTNAQCLLLREMMEHATGGRHKTMVVHAGGRISVLRDEQ